MTDRPCAAGALDRDSHVPPQLAYRDGNHSGCSSAAYSAPWGSIVTDIKTWFTPPPPQRQAVELSGGTHHRVDAGSVEFLFAVSQPTVTVVRAKAPVARWV